MQCSRCNFEGTDTAVYCVRCGTQLQISTPYSQPQGSQQRDHQPGQECSRTSISPENTRQKKKQGTARLAPWWMYVLLAVLVIIAIGAIGSELHLFPPSTPSTYPWSVEVGSITGRTFLYSPARDVFIEVTMQNVSGSTQVANSLSQWELADTVTSAPEQEKTSPLNASPDGTIPAGYTIHATLIYQAFVSVHEFTLSFMPTSDATPVTWDIRI